MEAKRGNIIIIKDKAVGEYPKNLANKELKVTAAENYGVFVKEYNYLVLHTDYTIVR